MSLSSRPLRRLRDIALLSLVLAVPAACSGKTEITPADGMWGSAAGMGGVPGGQTGGDGNSSGGTSSGGGGTSSGGFGGDSGAFGVPNRFALSVGASRMSSTNYVLTLTTGESPGGNGRMTSTNYALTTGVESAP